MRGSSVQNLILSHLMRLRSNETRVKNNFYVLQFVFCFTQLEMSKDVVQFGLIKSRSSKPVMIKPIGL